MKNKPFFNYLRGMPKGAVQRLLELQKLLDEMYEHRDKCKTKNHVADSLQYHRKLERREDYLTGFIDGWRSKK